MSALIPRSFLATWKSLTPVDLPIKRINSTPEVAHTGVGAWLRVGDREALGGMAGEQGAVHSRVGRPRRQVEGLHKEGVLGLRRKKGGPHTVAWQEEPAVTGTAAVPALMVVARSRLEAGRLGRGRARNPWVAAWVAAVVKAMEVPRCRKGLQDLAGL